MFPAPPPAPRLPAADCSPATSVIRELRPGSEVSCIAPYALHGSQHDRLPSVTPLRGVPPPPRAGEDPNRGSEEESVQRLHPQNMRAVVRTDPERVLSIVEEGAAHIDLDGHQIIDELIGLRNDANRVVGVF